MHLAVGLIPASALALIIVGNLLTARVLVDLPCVLVLVENGLCS